MAWVRAIGLMSGTSMDGVDLALIETDGEEIRLGPNKRVQTDGRNYRLSYSADEKALLAAAKEEARRSILDRDERPGCVFDAEALVTRRHAEVVRAFLSEQEIDPREIAVLGFHGQTVLHRPEAGLTVQIGGGQALAEAVGIPVVHDLRARDVAAGGQGAPLVPVFHRALARACGFELPLAVLNIGGVANVTFIGEGDILAGFDTGPGNALLDDLVRERAGLDYDEGGRLAAAGRVDEDLVAWMLQHPFFRQPPPKSLDRDAFSHRFVGTMGLEDAAATLTAFTARAIAAGIAWMPANPSRWIVGGGGARNATIMGAIRRAVGTGVEVVSADEVGWDADVLEAQAFAFLAVRSMAGLPITFPGTTGVAEPTTGGTLVRPR